MIRWLLIFVLFPVMASATTYYVETPANGGSDAATGLSWTTSWATISKVNANLTDGDTVYFATGIWRDTVLLGVSGVSYLQPTVYACSAFADTNGDGVEHFAELRGSDSITGWTLSETNIYVASMAQGYDLAHMFQNDSLLNRVASLQQIRDTGVGSWFYDSANSQAYAHVWGGDDPDGYGMEVVTHGIVDLDGQTDAGDAESFMEFYGLRMKYSHTRMLAVDFEAGTSRWDSITIRNCVLTHNIGGSGSNPALYYSGSGNGPDTVQANNSNWGEGLHIVSCSLGYAWSSETTDPWDPSFSNKGSGIDWYGEKNAVVESCAFFGFINLAGIYQKAGYASDQPDSFIVRHNTFNLTSGDGVEMFGDGLGHQIYGNTFINVDRAVHMRGQFAGEAQGYIRIFNNTFINCQQNLVYAECCQDGATDHYYYNEFKYNIVMQTDATAGWDIHGFGAANEFVIIDTNIYFDSASGGLAFTCASPSTSNWTQWQAANIDLASTNGTSPGFDDFGSGDYARTSASSEMDTTYADGWQALLYGAWQPATTPPPPVQSITIDTLLQDYVDELDRYKFSYTIDTTSTGVVAENIYMRYGNSPILPTPTVGESDPQLRVRAFHGSIPDSNFEIEFALTEPDYIYVRMWTHLTDSGFSSPLTASQYWPGDTVGGQTGVITPGAYASSDDAALTGYACTTGTNRMLVFTGASERTASAGATNITGVTYAGVPMVRMVGAADVTVLGQWCSMWVLPEAGITAGSNDFVVTHATTNLDSYHYTAVTLVGVHQDSAYTKVDSVVAVATDTTEITVDTVYENGYTIAAAAHGRQGSLPDAYTWYGLNEQTELNNPAKSACFSTADKQETADGSTTAAYQIAGSSGGRDALMAIATFYPAYAPLQNPDNTSFSGGVTIQGGVIIR